MSTLHHEGKPCPLDQYGRTGWGVNIFNTHDVKRGDSVTVTANNGKEWTEYVDEVLHVDRRKKIVTTMKEPPDPSTAPFDHPPREEEEPPHPADVPQETHTPSLQPRRGARGGLPGAAGPSPLLTMLRSVHTALGAYLDEVGA